MNKEEIATTYKEYKNGLKLVSGLGRLNCYQGLDYLFELLEKDKFYSEELEDTIVFIESHINRIEQENKHLKDNWNKLKEYLQQDINSRNGSMVVKVENGNKIETISPIYVEMIDKSKAIKEILNKIQELEKGDSNVGRNNMD